MATVLVYAKDAMKLADSTRFIERLQELGLPQPDPIETFMLLAYTVANLVIRQDRIKDNLHFKELFLKTYDFVLSETLAERFGSDPHRARFQEYKELALFAAMDKAIAMDNEAIPEDITEKISRVVVPHLFPSLQYSDVVSHAMATVYFAYAAHVTKHLIDHKGP